MFKKVEIDRESTKQELDEIEKEIEKKRDNKDCYSIPSTSKQGLYLDIKNNTDTSDNEAPGDGTSGHAGRKPIIRKNKKDEPIVQLKIDRINLPYFDGDLTEWIPFRELFTYLIHENQNLSETLKFHQLRSHLKGADYDTIKGYQLSGLNYESAWNHLKRRYDGTDELTQEYIRKFLETPAILHKAYFTKFRAIIDATNQMLRALPN